MQKIADETTRMVSLFGMQEFEKVVELAEEHLLRYPDDTVVSNLREKSRQYMYEPPGDDWDGIN